MRHCRVALAVSLLCALLLSSGWAQPSSLLGIWDKVAGPGDPIRYSFLSGSKVAVHFQTSIDTFTYLTFPIFLSSLRELGLGQGGEGMWLGIHDIHIDTLIVEGFWHTGLPPAPIPTTFTSPTTYRKVSTEVAADMNGVAECAVLCQNYPNPFNPHTTISFTVSQESFVTLNVVDALGKNVATLLAEHLYPGHYDRQWNAAGAASGVYFYRLKVGGFVQTRRMMVVR